MKKVSVPCEIRDQQLYMPQVAWPQRCPCCGREAAPGEYTLKHNAQYQSWSTPPTTHRSGYPLEWQAPYCGRCERHAKPVSDWPVMIFGIGLVLTLALMVVLPRVVPVLLFLAAELVTGIILHAVLVRVIARPKMSTTCSHEDYAVFASGGENEVLFHFYADDYGERFAEVN